MSGMGESGSAMLAVTRWGDVGAPGVLALHPGVGDRRIWERCAPVWAERAGVQVITYDRRGFGDTTYRAEAHDDLDDLLAVMDDAGLATAVLVGNSMGGGLALDCTIANPNRVDGLVLIGALPSGAPEDRWVTDPAEAAVEEDYRAADASGDTTELNRIEARYWLDGARQPEGRVTGEARELFLDMNGRALAAAPVGEAAERPPAWPHLGEVDVPTLLLLGEHDEVGMAAIAPLVVEAMPAARLQIVPGAAHCPQLDAPDAIDDAVVGFLGQLERV